MMPQSRLRISCLRNSIQARIMGWRASSRNSPNEASAGAPVIVTQEPYRTPRSTFTCPYAADAV